MRILEKEITRRIFLENAKRGLVLAAISKYTSGCSGNGGPFCGNTTVTHGFIDQSLCTGCGNCIHLCPMGAIELSDTASINTDQCAECGVCRRSGICSEGAIKEGNLGWPRILREIFSNPLVKHKSTGVRGRGTSGIKCNDSLNRYTKNHIGIIVELGRPVPGTRLYNAERVIKKFRSGGHNVAGENPFSSLISDPSTGKLRADILNERVISCLLEFAVPIEHSRDIMPLLQSLSGEIDTVFNVCIALTSDNPYNSNPDRIFGGKSRLLPHVKVNIGAAKEITTEVK